MLTAGPKSVSLMQDEARAVCMKNYTEDRQNQLRVRTAAELNRDCAERVTAVSRLLSAVSQHEANLQVGPECTVLLPLCCG